MVSFMPQSLYPVERTPVPSKLEVGCSPEAVKRFLWKEKKNCSYAISKGYGGTLRIISRITGPKNQYKQDRECTHNLILRCVRVTIVAVEKL